MQTTQQSRRPLPSDQVGQVGQVGQAESVVPLQGADPHPTDERPCTPWDCVCGGQDCEVVVPRG